jgi:hypothetical protein
MLPSDDFGFSFSGPLQSDPNNQEATPPAVLLLDPTPQRMNTATILAKAGWLPVSANTAWSQCLELALATFFSSNTCPSAVILEASHPLKSHPHTPNLTALTPARQYYELPQANRPLTAHELAGYLVGQGISPEKTTFILYTSYSLASLSTPTRLNSFYGDPNPPSTYFAASVERLSTSSSPYQYYPTSQHLPSTSFGAIYPNLEGITKEEAEEGQPDPSEDQLLAVMTYLTGIYLCRNCHDIIAPHELAHLEASYQLWCAPCTTELLTPKRQETSLSPFRRRLNQLYQEQYRTQPYHSQNHSRRFYPSPQIPFPFVPPLYPAGLLAKAAFTLVTGTTSQNLDRTQLEDPGNDPWNGE